MKSMPWICAVFFALVGLQATAQNHVFITPPQYSVGSTPIAVVAADFNGDGKLDLAVTNGCLDSGCGGSYGVVSILLGNGDGTFQAHTEYPLPSRPYTSTSTIAVGDFNGDGKLDLAVANGAVVSVLFGNGDGTFQTHVDYGAAGGTSSVAVGDFNGDGKPDLAVTGGGSVSIYLNSGNGTFPTRSDFSAGGSVAIGDFNKDGKLDLVTLNTCVSASNCSIGTSTVSILLGNGDGTFQTQVQYPVGAAASAVAVGDLNGDGVLDLAVLNSNNDSFSPLPGTVSVLFGNGDGTFQSQQVYPAGLNPIGLVVGDFNGDGALDFAVTSAKDADVGVYLNQGNGAFSQPSLLYGTPAGAAVAGDFNQDNKLDLAVLGQSGSSGLSGIVSLLVGRGDGGFSQTSLDYPTGSYPISVAVADVNGDGKNDVVVANSGDKNVSVFPGNGDGTFQPRVNYGTGNTPQSVVIADINGDGKPDLVVANMTDNTVSVLLNDGSGGFAAHVDYATAIGPSFVGIGDVNGDGKADLLVTCANDVSILLGNGDGTFQTHTDIGPGGTELALGDFNGDGFLDFAVVGFGSGITVFLNDGHGAFGSTPLADKRKESHDVIKYMIITTSISVVVVDFNGDGKLDLAVGQSTGAGGTFDSLSVEIFLGNGDGTFQAPQSFAAYGAHPAVADFNGDGILDLAYSGGLLLGEGNGQFQVSQVYPTGSGDGATATGDFNGDGKPDLAVVNGSTFAGSNILSILLNSGQAAPSFNLATSPSNQTVVAGNSVTFTVTAKSQNGFNSAVTLACKGQPTGATCTPKPASITPTTAGVNSTVTVTTSASTAVGTYIIEVTGTSGSEQISAWPSITVSPAPPDFNVSVPSAATPNSVTPGQSATAVVTLGSSGGFAGIVNLTCSVSPAVALAPMCSFSPQQIQVTGSGSATATLMIKTTGSMASLGNPPLGRAVPIYAAIFPIFGAVLLGLRFGPRGRRKNVLPGLVMCCVLLTGLVFQTSCGGSSSTPSDNGGTPAGNYTVTVTASAASQHTTALTLTVQ
jgi:hypothetical protein